MSRFTCWIFEKYRTREGLHLACSTFSQVGVPFIRTYVPISFTRPVPFICGDLVHTWRSHSNKQKCSYMEALSDVEYMFTRADQVYIFLFGSPITVSFTRGESFPTMEDPVTGGDSIHITCFIFCCFRCFHWWTAHLHAKVSFTHGGPVQARKALHVEILEITFTLCREFGTLRIWHVSYRAV